MVACKLPCTTDQDCSPSGLTGAFTGSVCASDGYCASMGCASDAECFKSVGGANIKMFCTAPVVGTANPYASAITD